MKQILDQLYQHKLLSKSNAKELLLDIVNDKYNTSQTASFLTVFMMRKITIDELKGFREALLELCLKVDLSEFNPMDLCGTGGDTKNTFNISTLTAFIVAGAGIPVAKHGNYGVSSISGSSNVLEGLGVVFTTHENLLKQQLQEANICFLHAPLFHPSLKYVAPVRKQLGVKTFFNMLGPLVNPAQPKVQMTGVFSLELARMYQYILHEEISTQYSIVHGYDGYDEISLTDTCKIFSQNSTREINPHDFGFETVNPKSIFGGNSIAEAVAIFQNIIDGKGTTEQNNVVLANAAIAIQTYFPKYSLTEALEVAKQSLFNLKAKQSLEILKIIK